MKANELMVGDWVYSSFYYNSTKPCRITGIRTFDIKDVYAFVYIDKVEDIKDINSLTPIPLTPEILEKNGFKKFNFRGIDGQHEWTWWNNTLTNVSLWCRELNDNTKDGWMIRIESPTSSLCVKVEFLHELQHTLKLCGIEKEITL